MLNEWEGTPWQGGEVIQARAQEFPDMDAQIAQVRGTHVHPWRQTGVREAMSVPAIFRSVVFISNTTGALSLEAYRKGRRLEPEERPRLIVRPDPFRRPRSFLRDTAYNMATRGEAWWWVAKRDIDGAPLSLLNVAPQEVVVSEDPRDLRYPVIEWRGRRMTHEDMIQITLIREPGSLRGAGPLQMCGAAVSVSVEAQYWAANYYAEGGYPSVNLHDPVELTQNEAEDLRKQWVQTPPNTPQVTSGGLELREVPINQAGPQMLQQRDWQVGEAVRMLGLPASFLAYAVPGTSLTYANVGQELDRFTRTVLWPDYLEPIEQAMSDLLTRSTVARFNVDALLRADVETRWKVYKLAVDVLGQQEAAQMARESEGLTSGDIETAPVPFAPPQAIPSSLPVQGRSEPAELRCDGMATKRRDGISRIERCNRLLSMTGSYRGRCPRCKKEYGAA